MKIGINASFLRKRYTGIGQVTLNVIRALIEAKKDSNYQYILYLEEDVDLPLPNNFSKQVFLPKWKRDDLIRKIWWEKFLLPRKIKQDGCDLFISLYQCPTILSDNLEHIMIVHDIIPRIFPEYVDNMRKKLYWRLTEKGIKNAKKIISVSKRTEKDLIKLLNIDPHKITTQYIATDPIFKKCVDEEHSKRVLEKYELEPGYIYAGGGLDMRKNIEGLLEAYSILKETIDDAPKLIISGKLMPEMAPLVTDVETVARKLCIENDVQCLGFVDEKDLPSLYRNAAVFVFPSLYEGFGLPVLEAMHQGTPIVTSKRSSLPEVGGDAVLYCDPENPTDIARSIQKVLTNNEIKKTLSERSLKRSDKFTWSGLIRYFEPRDVIKNRKNYQDDAQDET